MLKFFFKWNLNVAQKLEFDKTVAQFNADLKKFRQKELKVLRAFQLASLLCFTMNIFLILQGELFYGFVIIPYFSGVFFTYKIYKEEYGFLVRYDFNKCNPASTVFKFFSFSIKSASVASIGTLTLSGLTVANYAISEATGYSPIQEFGMKVGLHKDSPNNFWKDKEEDK